VDAPEGSVLSPEVLILGAGMIGTCAALQLARRGLRVALLDRREPGRETSYGNAGLVQREAVQPYPFPRDAQALGDAAFGRTPAVHWQAGALPALLAPLARYWWHSAPQRHARISAAWSALIAHSQTAHADLIAEAGAGDLIRPGGYLQVFRSAPALAQAAAKAQSLASAHGLEHQVLDARRLQALEPALHPGPAGAVHWQQPWAVRDPGALVQRYARRLERLGAPLLRGDAMTLEPWGEGWRVHADEAGWVHAPRVVIALGPWSAALTRRLGYRLPLFVKRGYHLHHRGPATGPGLRLPVLDAECGYVLAPMAAGLRLTTGAEFAPLDSPPTPVQLARASACARELIELGEPLEAEPWLGNRPCSADMLPFIGEAPRHPGLWFDFGHGHQGFTLGPVSGTLLADLMTGAPPLVDPRPYAPARI
jgi:D-amino-acid dehydrogenase